MNLAIQCVDAIVPLCALLLLGHISYQVYQYVLTLNVVGKPNEWVIVINNGQMKQAGVGLNLVRSPWDTVARFPTKSNKVDFKTQQITSEMQGLEVQSMIVWSINRVGDGPFRAYKNLGADLIKDVPTTANNLIIAMAQAIVRNTIANSTIETILRDYEALKKQIIEGMTKVCGGWGVWLETVEILDVKIISSTLFKNMQYKFREDQQARATLEKLDVDNTLKQSKLEIDTQVAKRRLQDAITIRLEKLEQNIKARKRELTQKTATYEIDHKKARLDNQKAVASAKATQENLIKKDEMALEELKLKTKQKIEQIQFEMDQAAQSAEYEKAKAVESNRMDMEDVEAQLEQQKNEFQLTVSKMGNAEYVKNLRSTLIKEAYRKSNSSSKWYLSGKDGQDGLVTFVDGLIEQQMAVPDFYKKIGDTPGKSGGKK